MLLRLLLFFFGDHYSANVSELFELVVGGLLFRDHDIDGLLRILEIELVKFTSAL